MLELLGSRENQNLIHCRVHKCVKSPRTLSSKLGAWRRVVNRTIDDVYKSSSISEVDPTLTLVYARQTNFQLYCYGLNDVLLNVSK
jgi:hypothetical protein